MKNLVSALFGALVLSFGVIANAADHAENTDAHVHCVGTDGKELSVASKDECTQKGGKVVEKAAE